MVDGQPECMAPRFVLFVLFDDLQSLDLTGPLEVFAGANRCLRSQGQEPLYEVSTASLGGVPIRSSSGLCITPDADLRDRPAPDILIVPGGYGAHSGKQALVEWLRDSGRKARLLVSVCSGAYLLAEAGLLAGRRVTTHWDYAERLAATHPEVTVDAEPIFIRDGDDLATSAGVTSGIDLALDLVEQDLGHEVALTIARHLVVFLRRPGNQAQFSAQLAAQIAHREPLRDVQRWIAERPDADLSVEALAKRAHLSPRQFARSFTAEVGMTPGRYVDLTRLEAARRRLEDTRDGIAATAKACGYGTPEAMRRAFVRVLDLSPAEYRRRYS